MSPSNPALLHRPRPRARSAIATLLGLATGIIGVLAPGSADAYPVRNARMEFTQPDGSPVWVILNGDEFYLRGESLDGYALVFDPASGYIEYAMPDGQGDLVPSGIAYASGPSASTPASVRRVLASMGISPGLRRSPTQVAALHAAARQQLAPRLGQGRVTRLPGGPGQIVTSRQELPPAPPSGSVTGLVVAVDFSDRPGSISLDDIEAAFNGDNYGSTWHGSIRNWSEVISGGQTSVSHLVVGYYQAAYPTAHYRVGGEWDYSASEELYEEVYAYVDANVDLSSIAVDGQLMSLALLYAGDIISNGWASALWPHGGCGGWGYRTSEGVSISHCYLTNLGDAIPLDLETHRHELGHSFWDWPDTYDYDDDSQSGGGYATETDLPCAPFRMWAGWLDIYDVTDAPGVYSLDPNGDSCLVYENGDNRAEYFVAEYMVRDEMRPTAPDEGLLVWHVDEDGDNSWQDMTPARHYMTSVEQADGRFDLENDRQSRDGDLFHAGYVDRFDETTTPDTNWWNGSVSGFELCDISGLDSTMTVNVGCEPVVGTGGSGTGGASSTGGSGTGGLPSTGGAGGSGACTDSDANCSYWASIGECSANPGYMLTSCCASCEALAATGGAPSTGGAPTGGVPTTGGVSTGGAPTGGASLTGGAAPTGGSAASGAVPVTSGGGATGGMAATGAAGPGDTTGGVSTSTGGAPAPTGGAWATGGLAETTGDAGGGDSSADGKGCGCRAVGTRSQSGRAALLALLGLAVGLRRRRRMTARRST